MATDAIRLTGDRHLRRQIARLTGPQLRRVTTKGLRVALRPMLRQAKRFTPRETGRLRASLGVEIRKPRGGSLIIGRLGPRRDVRYTAKGGVKRVTGFGSVKRKALAKGYSFDRTPATVYARGIEFGHDRSGRVRRKRGGAHFLSRAFAAGAPQAPAAIEAALRSFLTQR